jgi:tetratricopeptide (TPR) repeat protein
MVETESGTLRCHLQERQTLDRSLGILIIIAVLVTAGTALSQTEPPSAPVPLAKEVEGLAPGPRIAYLEYLLATKGGAPEIYFQLGVAFYEGQQPDSALFYYAKATALDPRLSKAYVNMGVIFDEQHRQREAIGMFEKAAELNPEDVLAHSHASYMLFDAGEYEAAWTHLSRALAIDSLNPQPHFYLAVFFWESGMFRESLVEFEKVVSLASGGHLAERAEENITILQEALQGSGGDGHSAPRW